jgi:hypothetical protein
MKLFAIVAFLVPLSFILLGGSSIEQQKDSRSVHPRIRMIAEKVDIDIIKYPVPLNMAGHLNYTVQINGTRVKFDEECAEKLFLSSDYPKTYQEEQRFFHVAPEDRDAWKQSVRMTFDNENNQKP